jgi:Flp pilus assembly CpaE family ATPase
MENGKGSTNIKAKPKEGVGMIDGEKLEWKKEGVQARDSAHKRREPVLFLGIMGAKGGQGASMFASSLASILALEKRPLLIDLDPFATHRHAFEKKGFSGIAQLASLAEEIDPHSLSNLIGEHPSGYHLLPGARSPEDESLLTAEKLEYIYQLIGQIYELVLIDISSHLEMIKKHALLPCSIIFFVMQPDLLSLRCGARTLELARKVEANGTHHWGLIINRYNRSSLLRPRELAEALELPLVASLPEDALAAERFSNFGKISPEGTPYIKSITDLALNLHLLTLPRPYARSKFSTRYFRKSIK